MTDNDFQLKFNILMGRVMVLLEVSENYALKREIKSALFDFSDDIREIVIKEKEIQNDSKKQSNNL